MNELYDTYELEFCPVCQKNYFMAGEQIPCPIVDTGPMKEKKMLIQKVSADRLNPAAYNPRRDLKPGDKDYEKLKRSIEEFGFVEPVVWK